MKNQFVYANHLAITPGTTVSLLRVSGSEQGHVFNLWGVHLKLTWDFWLKRLHPTSRGLPVVGGVGRTWAAALTTTQLTDKKPGDL